MHQHNNKLHLLFSLDGCQESLSFFLGLEVDTFSLFEDVEIIDRKRTSKGMLEEEGSVKEVVGDRALVLTERRGACTHCAARKACHGVDGGKEAVVQVFNPIGAGVGDRVKIAIKEGVILKSSFILYFIPTLGLIVGSALGYNLGKFYNWNLDLSALIGGLLLLGVSFLITFILNHHAKNTRSFWPQIQEVIAQARPDSSGHTSSNEEEESNDADMIYGTQL